MHPAAVFPNEPIFRSNRNEEIETENLSTAASRFGLRSATELGEIKNRDRLRSHRQLRHWRPQAGYAAVATIPYVQTDKDAVNKHMTAEPPSPACQGYRHQQPDRRMAIFTLSSSSYRKTVITTGHWPTTSSQTRTGGAPASFSHVRQ